MHELSIALSIVEMVEEEMRARRTARVVAVHVKLGVLSGVVKNALISSYDAVTEATSLAGSSLVVEELPVLVDCPQCGAKKRVQPAQWFCCETCGMPAREIVQGRELLVSAVEVLE